MVCRYNSIEVVDVDRLVHCFNHAALVAFVNFFLVEEARNCDHLRWPLIGRILSDLNDLLCRFMTVHIGHLNVHEDHLEV